VTQVTTKEFVSGRFTAQETYTFHRGFRGELIKHGVHRKTLNGKVELEEHYREGVLHGPYQESSPFSRDTRKITEGEYRAGMKHGTWSYAPDWIPHIEKGWESPLTVEWLKERYRVEEHWDRGRRDGLFQWWDEAGKLCFSYEFKDDRLIVPAGNHSSLLLRRIADGQLTDTRVQQALVQRCDFYYHDWPLHSAMENTAKKHGLRFAFRSRRIAVPQGLLSENQFDYFLGRRHTDSALAQQLLKAVPTLKGKLLLCDAPIRVDVRNGPLHAGLEAMLTPLGLAIDYRNGIFCIVDTGSPYDWEAATGVSQLHPPAGSALAAKLDKPAKLMAQGTLRRVLGNLAVVQEIPVKIDFSNEELAAREYLDGWLDLPEGSFSTTTEQSWLEKNLDKPVPPKALTLRELLTILLDQANLHCHEEKGVLMIEAPPR
jgi:hypothetical protein